MSKAMLVLPKRSDLVRFQRPLQFAMVGVVGAAVNSGLFIVLISRAKWSPLMAGALATELAILCNFALNDRWTFFGQPYRRHWLARALRYNAIASGGLVMSVATLVALIRFVGMNPIMANTFGLLVSFGVNYTANKRFTFSHRPELVDSVAAQLD